MNVVYIRGEITQDYVIELMDRLSMLESDTATLYITSHGGDWNATQVLKDYLEEWFESVDIIISGYAISSAWRLVLLLKNANHIKILRNAYAQDHLSMINSGLTFGESTNYDEHFANTRNTYESDKKWWIGLCKNEFKYQAKELKDLKDGKEVFFNSKRMGEILDASQYQRKL